MRKNAFKISMLLGMALAAGSAGAQTGSTSQAEDISFKVSAEKSVPLAGVADLMHVNSFFNPVLQSTEIEDKYDGMATALPQRTNRPSDFFRQDVPANSPGFKASVETPVIIRNFNGASDNQYTPPDNNIAVSNGGYVVSAMNSNYRVYAPNMSSSLKFSSFHDALKTTLPNITDVYFDPKVIYDAPSDRFIMVLLNGILSSTSHIVVLFSKTNNPADGWNAYDIPGDIFGKGEWTDYPNIGASQSDVFITGNMFENNGNAVETAILQINKSTGYNGATLKYQSWEPVKNPGGTPSLFTLVPAPHGRGSHYGDNMYFVSNQLNGGNSVRLLEITGSQASGTASLSLNTSITYTSLLYSSPIPSNQKQTTTTFTLNSGDSRIKQAFFLNNVIHYVFSTQDQFTGFTDVVYSRLDVKAKTVEHLDLGSNNFNYVYPCLGSIGVTDLDKSVMIGYCKGGATIFPEIDAVQCDNSFTFSPSIVIHAGTSPVAGSTSQGNVLRWGDYLGMARQYTTNQVMFSGHYGYGSAYQTWIAELGLNSTKKSGISEAVSAAPEKVNVYPNPVNDIFSIEFETEERAHLNISLSDIRGRQVELLYDGTPPEGPQKFSFNKAALAPGIYTLAIRSDKGEPVTKKIVVN